MVAVTRASSTLYSQFLCTQYAELAGFDFNILPTAEVGAVNFYRFRENMSERTLIVAQALI